MSPMTTLLSAASAAPAASGVDSAAASISIPLSDFIPVPSNFVTGAVCSHNPLADKDIMLGAAAHGKTRVRLLALGAACDARL
jgi:hypothetical protein